MNLIEKDFGTRQMQQHSNIYLLYIYYTMTLGNISIFQKTLPPLFFFYISDDNKHEQEEISDEIFCRTITNVRREKKRRL